MTEDQIERIAERRMDRLDQRFIEGELSQDEYQREVHNLARDTDTAIMAARVNRIA